jgi:tetratricopeptide (TPR) repeat protein
MKLTKLLSFSFLAVLLVLTSAADLNAQSKKDLKRAKDLYETGNRSFNQRNYRDAVEKYAESLALAPNEAPTHFWKGYAHYYLKEQDLALKELNTAFDKGYKPSDIYKVRWYVNYELRNVDAALADIQEAMKEDPNNATMLLAAGDIYYDRSEFQKALDYYNRAAAGSRISGDLYYKMARAYGSLGNYEGQLEAALNATKNGTRFVAESWALIADAYQREGKNLDAVNAYKKVLAANPDNVQTYRTMAELYRRDNRISDAIQILDDGLKRFPRNGTLYTDIGWYYSIADMNQQAVDASKAATMLLPKEYLGYTNLCRAYNDNRQPNLAVGACNVALGMNPDDGETNFYLGRAYSLLKREDDAKKYYEKAIVGLEKFTKANPDYSDGFYLLGNAYTGTRQYDRAVAAYKRCTELNPSFVKARFNLGLIYVFQNKKALATEQYHHLESLDQKFADDLKSAIDKM